MVDIMNVTGHRNEQSLNDYDEGNEVEQRHISDLISNTNAGQNHQIETMSSPQQIPKQAFNYPHWASTSNSSLSRSGPSNEFYHCDVVFNINQVTSPKGQKRPFRRVILQSDSDSQE